MPGFFLKDINGKSFFLRDYVGEKAKMNYRAMIFSLSASYCKPCKKEIPELGKMMEKYKDRGLGIFLIAIEKENQARKLVAETKTTIPVLLDKYLVVPKLLGNQGIPFTILIDNEGTVRFINTGFSEKNAVEFIERFENEVVALLEVEKELE
ncbi:TlpA family protein disulfide reductase [Candidatus Latescibacterota bacterium]